MDTLKKLIGNKYLTLVPTNKNEEKILKSKNNCGLKS